MDTLMSTMISEEELWGLCKAGQGSACCRYVVFDKEGFRCAKHNPVLAAQINANVLAGTMTAIADNCEGKHCPQREELQCRTR
jgi:hypothetical protein